MNCHPKNWVRQSWIDYFGVDEGEPGVASRNEGSILEDTICYS